MKMVPVAVALGSNLGDRLGYLQRAIDLLSASIRFTQASFVYETAPQIVEDQPVFLNAAATGLTTLGPFALLDQLKAVEQALGRQTRQRFGPREIDIDLLAYGCLWLESPRLQVPHPAIPNRRFVLAPLRDVASDWVLPGQGTVERLFLETNDPAESVMRSKDAVLQIHRHG